MVLRYGKQKGQVMVVTYLGTAAQKLAEDGGIGMEDHAVDFKFFAATDESQVRVQTGIIETAGVLIFVQFQGRLDAYVLYHF